MSASKGQYTAETVTLVEGDIRTIRLTSDGKLMVDATVSSSGGATEVTLTDLNDKVGAEAAAADAKANPTVGLIQVFPSAFNGTTWDRIRSAVVTVSSTLTGFLNTLPWAIFHTTPATRTNNQGGPLEVDATGNLRTVEQFAPAAEDNTAGVIKVEHRYSYTHITTATTTVVKASAGFLHKIIWNKSVATGVTTVYDNTAGSGTVVAIRTVGAALLNDPPCTGEYNVSMATGITIVTDEAEDITVVWR
jgi:hypothetical protein